MKEATQTDEQTASEDSPGKEASCWVVFKVGFFKSQIWNRTKIWVQKVLDIYWQMTSFNLDDNTLFFIEFQEEN